MSDEDEDEVLFEESGGVVIHADMHSVHGMSPVRATFGDKRVSLSIHLSGGEAAADLEPDRAEELGEALIQGANRVRDDE
jgi:hypothetical protein